MPQAAGVTVYLNLKLAPSSAALLYFFPSICRLHIFSLIGPFCLYILPY